MKKVKNFLKAAEIAAGAGLFLLEQSKRMSPRVRSVMSDSMDDVRDRAKDAYDAIADRVSDINWRRERPNPALNVVRLAAGIGIGIGIGMLIAPAKGRHTRNRIAEKAHEFGDNVRQRFREQTGRSYGEEGLNYGQGGLQPTGTGD